MEEYELSDEFLIEAIAGRAMWALERLSDRYRGRFYTLAYRMTADKMVTEELVQDTFLSIWQSANSYNSQAGPVHNWLFSIIYHHTINYLRRTRHASALEQVLWQEVEAYERVTSPDVWEQACSSEQCAELHACLTQLPPEQWEVIQLAYFEGWTHGEIAQRRKIPLGTVKARIRLGVNHLRRALDREGEEKNLSSHKHTRKANPERAETVVVQAVESECTTGYELCREGTCSCFRYTEWETLIEQIETFKFRGTTGSFTARKEKRLHGRAYWYAYTWGSTGRKKTYLGRPAELTLAHLEAVAGQVNEA